MNILVIGSGGREHAICWKLKQSKEAEDIYCAPGNGGTETDVINVNLSVSDHREVAAFCAEKDIRLVIVGPEAPLAAGITDFLEGARVNVFGTSRAASQLEANKTFAKNLMKKNKIPTADFEVFNDFKKARDYIKAQGAPIVVKAFGLAAGKGVIVAETEEEAIKAAEDILVKKIFGSAGDEIIIEECLSGEEASILVVTDGSNVVPLATSQDHKRLNDGDKGPNTGGMGAYSPAPVIDKALFGKIDKTIIRPTLEGLRKEGVVYKGILYAGIMVTDSGPKVLEYNVRSGDPETQVILPRMKSDLAELAISAAEGDISGSEIEWDKRDCVCVVMTSKGYPGSSETGMRITGCKAAEKEGALVFHAGTHLENGELVTSGGRVLNVVGMGKGIKEAVKNTYKAAGKIKFEGMHYRKDIGYRAIAKC